VTKKERESLAGRLLGLAKKSKPLLPQEQLRVEFTDQGFGLDEGGLIELQELRDWLLRERGWGSKYSERHLSNLLAARIGALRKTLDYQDSLKAAEELDDTWLAVKTRRHVYVPIDNVVMSLRQLEIGRARLVRIGPKRRGEFEASVRKAFEASPLELDEIEARIHLQLDRFSELGTVASLVEVEAEADRAFEIGREETRRALDFLNYGASIIHGSGIRHAAGIVGDGFRGVRRHFAVTTDFTHFSSSADFSTGIAEVTLTADLKKRLNELGLEKVSVMLTKPTPTEFEEAVLQALHWYADAWLQPSLDNELLGLVTALETFFTRGRGMTGQIAEGVAFVLVQGLPPDDLLSARKHVVERVRLLYNLRGTVTHGGKAQILPAEVGELRFYVTNVINVMIQNPRGWATRQALHSWLDDQRLS
jgi:hypothetical protein